MQYLLTQEEYSDLLSKIEEKKRFPSEKELQKFATMIANEVPVKSGWDKGKVWGCIKTVEYEWYCDDCPAQKICPYPLKSWSK